MEVGREGTGFADRAFQGARRPTLLGSPMRTPLSSPCAGPSQWPYDVPALSLDEDETAALQAAIEASLGEDMKRRLQSSLQRTEQELLGGDEGPHRDLKRARIESSSELEEIVAKAASQTGESQGQSQAPGPEVERPTFSTYEYAGLLDHEQLLESIYAAQGVDLKAQQERATRLLAEVGLRPLDLGVRNVDEEGRELMNQCFYLSIARSYLGHLTTQAEVQKAALVLKRTVEACVLASHPDWSSDSEKLGENAMAFADFLPVAMAAKDPPNLVSRLAVLILDATQGHAEVYLGPSYNISADAESCRQEKEQNLVLLVYTPGHYKALVLDDDAGSKPAWTYSELKALLDQRGIMCIETCDFD